MKLILKGGRVIDPANGIEQIADVLIEDGKIAQVGTDITAEGAEIKDVTGKIVAPGFIDLHMHLREPGQEAKEDMQTATQAAAAGGFTTISCMPNTRPVVDSLVLANGLKQRAREVGITKVQIIGAVSKGQKGEELAELGDMCQAGVMAFSDDGHYVNNSNLFMNALDYIVPFGKRIISHAEVHSLVCDGHMHEGARSAMLGVKGRPSVAEDIAVARDLLIAEYIGGKVHIAHVSTKGAVELIRQAKARGIDVTAEVTPHHLSLTDEIVTMANTATKVNPPLRSRDHVDAMIQGLKDGTIDAIATDHSPHAFEEKDREYCFAPSGFSGLETALGVVLTNLYHTGLFTLSEIVDRMSAAPARVMGLAEGTLSVGSSADVVVFDPDAEWTVDPKEFYTRSKMTPYEGMKLKGKAVMTVVNGKVVMENGQITASCL